MSDYIETKKELVELVEKYLEKALESKANQVAYSIAAQQLHTVIPVGKVTLKEDLKHTQTYETAAWYTNYKIPKGEYEVFASDDYYNKGRYLNLSFECNAVVTESYTQSMFGGVAFGKSVAPEEHEDVGKVRHMKQGVANPFELLEKGDLVINNDLVAIANVLYGEGTERERRLPRIVLNLNHPDVQEKIQDEIENKSSTAFYDIYSDLNHIIQRESGKKYHSGIWAAHPIEGEDVYDILKSVADTEENRAKFKELVIEKTQENVKNKISEIEAAPLNKLINQEAKSEAKKRNRPKP